MHFVFLENSNDFDDIYLIGIKEKGYEVAKIIENELKLISNKNICLNSIKINKKNPRGGIKNGCGIKCGLFPTHVGTSVFYPVP